MDKFDELFDNKESEDALELITEDIQEISDSPVDMSALLGKLRIGKTNDLISSSEKMQKPKMSRLAQKVKTQGLIDEDYLRNLISDEVKDIMEEKFEELLQQISSIFVKTNINNNK